MFSTSEHCFSCLHTMNRQLAFIGYICSTEIIGISMAAITPSEMQCVTLNTVFYYFIFFGWFLQFLISVDVLYL